jgi:hypothetical protein
MQSIVVPTVSISVIIVSGDINSGGTPGTRGSGERTLIDFLRPQ